MPAYRLRPACKDYLWGGHRRLREDFGVKSSLDPLAEAWMLSCHPDGLSTLANGPYAGRTLAEYLAAAGPAALGSSCAQFDRFPLLIKLLDTEKLLSVQVHPTDDYALKNEGQYGKTEMWVVLSAEPGAFLYCGLEREVSRGELACSIQNGGLISLLHRVPARVGDVFFVPAGTLHAIGAGLVIAEIQQNSNLTYRVYDHGRLGPDGRPRALHIQKALDVARCGPAPQPPCGEHLGSCQYFTVDLRTGPFAGECGQKSFVALLAIEGKGSLACGGETQAFLPGGCFFLPAGSGGYLVEGACKMLVIFVQDPIENPAGI